jgi:hypothetical protein
MEITKLEMVKRLVEAVRDCGLNGHDWYFSGHMGGKGTNVNFDCYNCKARISAWAHNKEHETLNEILNSILNSKL